MARACRFPCSASTSVYCWLRQQADRPKTIPATPTTPLLIDATHSHATAAIVPCTRRRRPSLNPSADNVAGELARLTRLGATVVEERTDSRFRWWVLRNPEGNQFCLG